MRPDAASSNSDYCRGTMRLRQRLKWQEAEIARLHTQMDGLRAEIAAERAALTEWLEGPEARRDLVLFAAELLRADALEAARTRRTCRECGGLGREMSTELFTERLERLCTAHGLPLGTEPVDPEAWPTRPGEIEIRGTRLETDWLFEPEPALSPYARVY